jgi:hypothetical protein
MAAGHQEVTLVYCQDYTLPPNSINFPADVLLDIEGKESLVTLSATAFGKGEARWQDGGVPRSREFNTVVSEGLPELPNAPSHFEPVEPAFLQALAEAARTSAREGVRFALSRIQLRGRRGQVVATDGRQLLVQGGFDFPWAEDVLIPALPLFASRDLPPDGPVAIGRTPSHVTLKMGPWLLHMEVDNGGRYPDAEAVIPKPNGKDSRLHFSEDDALFLVHALPRLPGDKEDHSPVTLDLGKDVVVRAREGSSPQVSEVVLSGSSEGPPVRVAFNRRYLRRAVQMGFRDLLIRNPTTPLLCRDETRTYAFMPVEGVVQPTEEAVRIVSGEAAPPPVRVKPKHEPERRRAAMPRPPTNGDDPRNGPPRAAPPPTPRPDADTLDPLLEAEALRSVLHDAQARLARLMSALKQQRRQSRALQAAVSSIRNLRLDR